MSSRRKSRKIKIFVVILFFMIMGTILFFNPLKSREPSRWAEQEIIKAKELDIFEERLFENYHKKIIRKDIAYLIVKVYELVSTNEVEIDEIHFLDTEDIWIRKATALNFMQGYEDGLFYPNQYISRDEYIQLLNNVINKIVVKTANYKIFDVELSNYITTEEALVTVARLIEVVNQEKSVKERNTGYEYIPGKGTITENGALKVIEGQLCNKNGDPVQLKGLSTHGLLWMDSFITETTIKQFSREWNIDVLRLAIYYPEQWKTNGTLDSLKSAIDLATKYGIYVIIDWHGNPNQDLLLQMEESQNFFSKVSELYQNYDNVIYEIFNETNKVFTWKENLKPYAEGVIPVIRKNNKEAIIIMATPSWSQDPMAVVDNELEFENILYSLHFYAGTHKEAIRNNAKEAVENGLGLFATEWGTSLYTGTGGFFEEESNIWLEFLDEYKISWCNWNISNKDETSAIFKPEVNPSNGWTEEQISESGIYIKSKLIE